MSVRPVFVVAGVGGGGGTGAAAARLFAKSGYRVALIARNADSLNKLAQEINSSGGEAAAFPVKDYAYKSVLAVFDEVTSHRWGGEQAQVRVALWNAGDAPWKKFLDITEDELAKSLQTHVTASFAFSRQAILAFKKNDIDDKGRRGTLLFTGATASIRGNVITSAFAAGKFGLRALSQSLAKEFGKENIHVAHAIIDGGILTDRTPDAPSQTKDTKLSPESIAESYLYLTNQDRSSWTWELDLRPAHEKW